MSIKYAFVSRGNAVLADYSTELGAYRTASISLLDQVPSRSDRVSFPYDGLLYSFIMDSSFAFGVVTPESKKTLAFGYLEKVKTEFVNEYGAKGLNASEGGLDRTFGPRLKYWADTVTKNPEEVNKITNLQKKVDDVKTIMLTNIEEVVRRGEKLSEMDEKAGILAMEAEKFQETGLQLKKKMWWQKTKWQAIVGTLIAIAIIIICVILYYVFK